MMASMEADNVGMSTSPLSANPSRIQLCWRARAAMIASAYIYLGQPLGNREGRWQNPRHQAQMTKIGRRLMQRTIVVRLEQRTDPGDACHSSGYEVQDHSPSHHRYARRY